MRIGQLLRVIPDNLGTFNAPTRTKAEVNRGANALALAIIARRNDPRSITELEPLQAL